MPRRILIAPDKFKGSLTAREAAAAIAAGVLRREPDAVIDLCPIADGGEGFMETLAAALPGKWVSCPAVDALGRAISSRYYLAETGHGQTAILEAVETIGLWRIAPVERNPRHSSTRGLGLQMAHAVAHHAPARMIIGLGGSATNDGGCGMATALGVAFLGGTDDIPCPSNLLTFQLIDASSLIPLPPIFAACDVDNPLLGPHGATAVFGGQKGATEEDQIVLEESLAHFVSLSSGAAAAVTPGAGAAGGLGFGLLHFSSARLISGFDLLAEILQLQDRIRHCDLVITGEGSIDFQSLSGKGPVALARLAGSVGVPTIGLCGRADDAARAAGVFVSLHALAEGGQPTEILMSEAAALLTELAATYL